VLDAQGWFYRYAHLKSIDPAVRPGQRVKRGQMIGVLGKEGSSGGWSHLHFDIKAKQPSGRWGIQEGYAFLWEAYRNEHKPKVIAVARPHHLIRAGDKVVLDGSRSWSAGRVDRYEWTFSDGTTAREPRVEHAYDRPGAYSEVLKVVDDQGNVDYDFAVVLVIDKATDGRFSPTIHASYAPTEGVRPGDPVTFKVRTFHTDPAGETWDFGDGSSPEKVRSDGNAEAHARNGYAEVVHRYAKPGHYLVRVEDVGKNGARVTARLHVKVDEKATAPDAREKERPAAPAAVTVLHDLAYRDGPSKQWRLDLAWQKDAPGPPRPAVVVIHGGGWLEGNKSSFASRKDKVPGNIEDLADLGFVAVTINYLLSGEAPFPAALEDCKCAVRWLRAHARDYHIDPAHVGAYGNSAGGHLALLLGMAGKDAGTEGAGPYPDQSSGVQAVVSDSGPVDLLYQYEHDCLRQVVGRFLDGPTEGERAALYRNCPHSLVRVPALQQVVNEFFVRTRCTPRRPSISGARDAGANRIQFRKAPNDGTRAMDSSGVLGCHRHGRPGHLGLDDTPRCGADVKLREGGVGEEPGRLLAAGGSQGSERLGQHREWTQRRL
jgi:acetyl esterase/lipase